ncbi:MAG: preprotein translocase subunit YajC [Verrucomicrobiota bacterium]
MDLLLNILAQGDGQGGGIGSFLPIILMFVAMYFLIFAPQRKKQKEHKKMIEELSSGTEVITTGGIYGTVTNVKDDRFVLRIAENTKIEIARSSVASVVSKDS